MSSSQTMTAPAVGRRPPDPGPDMALYDYAATKPEDNLSSPRDDSAMRALHNSAFDDIHGSQDNLAGLTGAAGTAMDPEHAPDAAASGGPQPQSEIDKQSAASSLLAQLLGNQNQTSETPAQENPPEQHQPVDLPQENGLDHDQNPTEQPQQSAETKTVETQDATFSGSDPQNLSNENQVQNGSGDQHNGDQMMIKEEPPSGTLDFPALDGDKDQQHAELFPSFDMTAPPKDALEALQQNEMLTANFLSQGLDMSSLPEIPGYSQAYHDAAASIAGSEPRIQAFAKLEFDDGHFYVNTYSFILGRDVRAARAAFQRELQARQAMGRASRTKSSSGGNTSQTPNRVKREGSAIIGSVVSDRGGIMGFDPDVPPHMPAQRSRRSSNSSFGESGALHATPAQLQTNHTDYNALAMQSLHEGNTDAKPVDTLALLPSPDACPTIPIHPPATADGSAAGHRGISRKHVKIAYNFDKNFFEMEVIGRNGAFIGADWLAPGQIRPLHSGDYIQIGGVRIRFLLPEVPIGETGAERAEESFMEEEEKAVTGTSIAEESAAGNEVDAAGEVDSDVGEDRDKSKVTKIVFKNKESDASKPRASVEDTPDPSQQPIKRRGPGRPPKDGIMSKRERAEIAREQKLAAKREANGGVTPPPSNKSKVGRPRKDSDGDEAAAAMIKPEKRKYTKRKRPDGTYVDVPIPSTEGGDTPVPMSQEEYPKPPPVKKRKPSRSPSPNYPPESAYTPEDLAKPPYNYAVLIFDALTESPTPMTLKQIYRALKLKYPYFRFKCETEGWTSSVRHNLNGNSHLFMHAERDGKGWSWQLRPGASVEKEKKRRPSPPPSQPSTATPSAQNYMPPPTQNYPNTQNVPAHLRNQQYQFPSMPTNPYTPPAPAPQHTSPYAPQSPFPITNPLRNNLPPAFAQTTPSTYTSPYASEPPPQLTQLQQQQQQQQQQPPQQQQQPPPQLPQQQSQLPGTAPMQQHSPYPPQIPPQLSNINTQQQVAPQQHVPPAPPPMQHQVSHPPEPSPMPIDNQDTLSFNERANKAIDDFEAVLMEDYEDKNYIREVLKSARARALGHAQESSFPGGEPKDEAVLVDALKNLIGSLKEENSN
ncbi:hypothetical protein Plec18167_000123 [Paecilomyces lecythidis]|uniref:Forkhead domain protein n=1 Tax=Paecilomyces lecythidis TaxID=3004212 RepID=A0ABR3YD07_9EURO